MEKQTLIFSGRTERLDIFITQQLEGALSRNIIQNLIKSGAVLVNGKQRKASWPLEEGDIVEINPPEVKNTIKLKDLIIFEDKDFFVINKPAGLLVHPQSPMWEENFDILKTCEETLVSAIYSNPPKKFDLTMDRLGLVHRLDKETSGVMLIAKNSDFQQAMVELFASRQVHKTYNAICCGNLPDDKGTIDAPIGRVSGGKIKASPLGRQAITDYKVAKRANGFCFMELYPRTGRTNQLRVHMSWLGYPVLGDWLYKGASAPRLMLHAKKLEFMHPFTCKKLSFSAPLPKDFKDAWSLLASGPTKVL